MPRYIDADKLRDMICAKAETVLNGKEVFYYIAKWLEFLPPADVVEMEKYLELREAFVDFVCSGGNNPAPFCQNRCDGCVDSRGWCTYRECNGFNPDGERGEEP